MWPIYTITGYDASAHTSEETHEAAHNVPKGILRSVLVSGIFGWVMVSAIVLAMPSVGEAAKQGADVFGWLMSRAVPGTTGKLLWTGIVLANYLCGLACITSTSRMTYAFARDGGLPFSKRFRKVSLQRRGRGMAIWQVAARIMAQLIFGPAYSQSTMVGG